MASYEELIRQAKNSKLGKAIARLGPSQGQSQAVSSIKNYAQPYAQSFSAGAKQMGSGVGGAIRAPFDMYFNNQSAATNNRVSDMLRQQQARAMKSGNLTTARDRSQKIERLQNLNADTQINMGQQMNKDRTDSALGTGRVGLQLLGAKGITAPSLLGNTALFSGIGYGITRASGGSNADAITAAGSAGGDALMYRGINKVSDKLFTNPLLRMAGQKGNIPVRIGLGAGVNALANIGEDEVTTRITQGRAPTNQERLISGAIGTVTGGLSGGMGARQQLKGVEVPKVTTFKHQLELLAEQPRKMGKYSSSDISTAASVVLGKRKFPTKPTEGFTELFAYMNKQLNNEKYGDLLPKTDATSGMTRRVPGFIDPSAKVGGVDTVSFKEPYQRGDIGKLQQALDDVLGTNSFKNSGKWQADYAARNTAKQQLEYDAQSIPEARQLLDYVNKLEGQIEQAQGLKNTPKGNITQALPDIQNRSMADQAGMLPSGNADKVRGFTSSVQEAPNVSKKVKTQVSSTYTPKPNDQLMGEAKALLQDGAKLNLDKIENIDQKIAATIQEAINQQKAGNNAAAANLFNNLSEQGTKLGRGVQAFSLLQNMTPEAVSLSVAGKIKKYNAGLNSTSKARIPELTGQQQKLIADKIAVADLLTGREKQIALNELNKTINNFIPSTLVDKAITLWKAGLLTSLRTHERNLVGNTIHQAGEVSKDYIASPVDALLSTRTGRRTLTATTRGLSEGVSNKTQQQALDMIKLGYDPTEQLNKFDYKAVNWGNSKLGKAAEMYTNAVFRTLGAADKPFYNAAMARSLYDQAGAEAINAGKKGNKQFIESLVKKPTEDMLKTAISDANVATFKDRTMASNAANSLKRAMSDTEYGKFISEFVMPFTGVPSSIFTQLKNYSPIGLAQGMIKSGNVLAGKVPELQRQAAQEVGRGVIGTGIFGLGAYLMNKGLVTGQPKDAQEQRQWDLENKPRNSIMINGKWRSLNSIGPEAFIFLSGAKLQEELGKKDGSVGTYMANLGKDMLDQSFVTGIQQPVNAITDPARYGKSYLGGSISSVVPNIVKDTSKAFDTTAREANSVFDYAKMGIPGQRNTLTEKRDALGNVMPQEPTGVSAYFDLFNSKTPISNTVVNELSRLNKEGYGATPSKLLASQTIRKKKYDLTPEQLNTLESGAGSILRPQLEAFINSPGYKNLTDDERQKQIKKITDDARTKYKNINADTILSDSKVRAIFAKSKDDPKNILEKISLAAEGMTKDPKNTIKAIFTQEELRKIEGNAVILKRQEFLNKANDPNMQLDHIIPLGLGGDNSESNQQYLTKEYHKLKTALDTKLIRDLQNGKISRQDAQDQVREFANNNPTPRYVVESKTTTTPSTDYSYVDAEGNYKTVDISKVKSLPSTTKVEQIKKKKETYSTVTKVMTSELSEEQKQSALKELGVTKADAEYYSIAKENNEVKIANAYDTLDQSKSFDDFMKYLVNGRKPVNGQILVSDGVIDDLVNEGVIPYSVGKEIKDIDLNEDGTRNMGNIRAKSRKSGAAQQKKILALQKKDAEARMKAVNDLYNNLRKINQVSSGTPGKIKATSKVNTKALTFSGR